MKFPVANKKPSMMSASTNAAVNSNTAPTKAHSSNANIKKVNSDSKVNIQFVIPSYPDYVSKIGATRDTMCTYKEICILRGYCFLGKLGFSKHWECVHKDVNNWILILY